MGEVMEEDEGEDGGEDGGIRSLRRGGLGETMSKFLLETSDRCKDIEAWCLWRHTRKCCC